MVIFTLIDLAISTAVWVCRQTYNLGYYIVKRSEETTYDKILRQLTYLRDVVDIQTQELEDLKGLLGGTYSEQESAKEKLIQKS